jgi:hypothetical protein
MLTIALFFSFAQASEILPPSKPGIYNIGTTTARISFKDLSSNETEFKIYNNKTDLLQVISTKTELGTGYQYSNLKNLTACTVYSLNIVASNSTDDSNMSQQGQFKTACPTPLPSCTNPIQAPVNLGVYHIGKTTADFSFLDKSTNETGFRIYDNGTIIKTLVSTSPTAIDEYQYASFTNLQAGIVHSFKVEAYNTECNSSRSVKKNFRTLPQIGQNLAPVVNAGIDKSMKPGETIQIIGTATDDVAIDTNSYEWRDSNNILVATTASFSYTATTEGDFTFTFSAMDNEQLKSSDTVTINVKNITIIPPKEITLCNNKSAYINTLYSLGMNINSTTAHGSVFSKNNDFVGAVLCGEFANATSSSDVLNRLKNSAFPTGTTIISNNGADGSIKVQYGISNLNTQAYAQLKSILEAAGETDFNAYIDYSSFPSIQNLYIDIYVKFVNVSEVYLILAVSNQDDNNVDDLNKLVNGGTIGDSNVQNSKTDSYTYQDNVLKADILFVMDDSGSMSQEQSAASSAIITTFGTAMSSKGVDWKATVIGTERSRSYLTKHIDDPSENNISKLATQLLLGTNGYDEVGLLKAYTYLNNGDISVRNDSKLSIVYISDEIAHTGLSELGGISDINDSYFVQNNINFNVIIPEYLSNDNNLAYQMANKTGAEVANIYNYTNGYNAMMQKIADEAAGNASLIILTETAIIASIQVSVNGTVVNSGWTYNSSNKSIVFDALSKPNMGDTITVSYNY